jgi:hypothetical protein
VAAVERPEDNRDGIEALYQGSGALSIASSAGAADRIGRTAEVVAVAIAGKGHWITGTVMIVACYAFSVLVVERLFVIVKPKLLTIPWFAKIWEGFVVVRTSVFAIFRGWLRLPDRD